MVSTTDATGVAPGADPGARQRRWAGNGTDGESLTDPSPDSCNGIFAQTWRPP